MKKSKHSLKGSITTLRRGVAIYQTHASPYWYARVWDPRTQRNTVRSSRETSKIKAKAFANQLALDLFGSKPPVPLDRTFHYYCRRLIEKMDSLAAQGERNANYTKTITSFLQNKQWGLMDAFKHHDIAEIKTKDFLEYLDRISQKRPDLSSSTRNMLTATFRNVMKGAVLDGVIDAVPATPRSRQRDNPRAYFPFYPLVSREDCVWTKVRHGAQALAKDHQAKREQAAKKGEPKTILDDRKLRIVPATDELYDLILFTVYSFVRPTTSELYAIKHEDIVVADNPRRLLVTIKNGKTGYRVTNTMERAVEVYERIKARNPDHKPSDYLFYGDYQNRTTVRNFVQRQFRLVMQLAGVKDVPEAKLKYSIYSLRHTAICMRIVLGGGKVDIYTLAKNAGTSVEQIERFYAKNLPISAELARNLHHFEGDYAEAGRG